MLRYARMERSISQLFLCTVLVMTILLVMIDEVMNRLSGNANKGIQGKDKED